MIKLTQAIIIGVLVVLLFNLFTPSGIWLNFKINQSFIAKNLCVKKEIENNTCKGKCHLKKELEKVQKQETHQNQEPNYPQSTLDHLFNEAPVGYAFITTYTKIKFICSKTFDLKEGFYSIALPPPRA